MSESRVIVDASAVLALLKQEPFNLFDPKRVMAATISTVNLSEVLEKLYSGGLSETEADAAVSALDLQVIAFDRRQAYRAAQLRSATRRRGLSFGDRACIALGLELDCPVVTADRDWKKVDVGVEVLLIR